MRKLLALILPLLLLLVGIGTPFSYTCGICLPPCRAQENPQTAEESAGSSQTDTPVPERSQRHPHGGFHRHDSL